MLPAEFCEALRSARGGFCISMIFIRYSPVTGRRPARRPSPFDVRGRSRASPSAEGIQGALYADQRGTVAIISPLPHANWLFGNWAKRVMETAEQHPDFL